MEQNYVTVSLCISSFVLSVLATRSVFSTPQTTVSSTCCHLVKDYIQMQIAYLEIRAKLALIVTIEVKYNLQYGHTVCDLKFG